MAEFMSIVTCLFCVIPFAANSFQEFMMGSNLVAVNKDVKVPV